jgi:hypothetical protein
MERGDPIWIDIEFDLQDFTYLYRIKIIQLE